MDLIPEIFFYNYSPGITGSRFVLLFLRGADASITPIYDICRRPEGRPAAASMTGAGNYKLILP